MRRYEGKAQVVIEIPGCLKYQEQDYQMRKAAAWRKTDPRERLHVF